MNEISEYINNILNEIETDTQTRMPTSEVMNRLLGRKNDGNVMEDTTTSSSNSEEMRLIDTENLDRQVSEVNKRWQITYYRTIYSCRRSIGKVIVIVKKTIRKLMKFLLLPIIEDQNQFNAAATNAINAIRNNDTVFDNHIRNLREEVELLKEQLQQNSSDEESREIYRDVDYFDFENEFRGGSKKIKKAQEYYVQYFKGCKKVFDLGSGRGEFLELLQENNIPATGVEMYEEFVRHSRERNLDIVQDDCVAFLKQQSEDSCDGIFAAQLVEHLETKSLIDLCNESYRVLHQGGKIVLETPNPTCVSTYLNSFYLDPSHIKPVHPKTLEYFLHKAGFEKVDIVYTEQSKVPYRLPLLNVENANLNDFNDGINFLSDIIFGSQDYAIIAEKE